MSLPISAPVSPSASSNGNPLLKSGKADSKAEKFSFFDFLDVINPLQHIPIVNNIYREVTGDKINNAARIAGGALYGGFIGAAIGMANSVAVNETGSDIGGIAMHKMGLTKETEIASADAVPSPSAPPASANIPVVEIRPSDKFVKKDDIVWDHPVEMASAAVSNPADQMFRAKTAAAMPSPKELNDLQPGSSSDNTVPSANENFDKPDVQKNMLNALSKYSAMQKVSDQAAPRPAFANLMSSPEIATKEAAPLISPEFKKFRRYHH